jgi:hypothetical protein
MRQDEQGVITRRVSVYHENTEFTEQKILKMLFSVPSVPLWFQIG